MFRVVAAVASFVILSGCSSLPGVGDVVSGDGGDNPFENFEDAFDPDPVDISGLGAPPSAEPGTTVVEFDGNSYTFALAGTSNPRCSVDEERFQVAMQSTDGNLLIFDGATTDRGETGWQGGPVFDAGNQHHEGNSLSGHVVVDGDTITYQGTITTLVDRSDINSWIETLGSATANCSRPGGLPSATIAGTTYEIPISGANQFVCDYSETRFEFELDFNTIGQDKYPDPNYRHERIRVEARLEGERWIGGVGVDLGADRYQAFVPEDLAGMEVGPTGATWSGTLTHTNQLDDGVEEEVEASISFVC